MEIRDSGTPTCLFGPSSSEQPSQLIYMTPYPVMTDPTHPKAERASRSVLGACGVPQPPGCKAHDTAHQFQANPNLCAHCL